MEKSWLSDFNDNLSTTEFNHVDNQTPKYGVLTCSDSRVNLSHFIGGDIYNEVFLIENAGNKVNENNIGSIHYALSHLGVELFMVLGHSSCGACGYAMNTKLEAGEKLLDIELKEQKKLTSTCSTAKELELLNIKVQVEKLREQFPEYKDKIVGTYYDLENKRVEEVK